MRNLWEKWKELAEKIGDFQANLIFSIFYFLLMMPIGLVSGIFADFLALKKDPQWGEIDAGVSTLEEMKEQ